MDTPRMLSFSKTILFVLRCIMWGTECVGGDSFIIQDDIELIFIVGFTLYVLTTFAKKISMFLTQK